MIHYARRLPAWALIAAIAALFAFAGAAVGLVSNDGQVMAGAERPALEPALAGAPWLDQAAGSPHISTITADRPALRFPAGTSYQEALSALYVSALETGRVPEGSVLVDPLAAGVVVSEDAQGLTLSLDAPFGYDLEEGLVRPPSFHLPGDLSPERVQALIADAHQRGAALPEGAAVDVPALADCQIAASGEPAEACPVVGVTP